MRFGRRRNVDNLRWHDLRLTFANRMVMAEVDILTVNKLLRQDDLQTTMRYAHLAPSHLAAVETLTKSEGSPKSDNIIDTAVSPTVH